MPTYLVFKCSCQVYFWRCSRCSIVISTLLEPTYSSRNTYNMFEMKLKLCEVLCNFKLQVWNVKLNLSLWTTVFSWCLRFIYVYVYLQLVLKSSKITFTRSWLSTTSDLSNTQQIVTRSIFYYHNIMNHSYIIKWYDSND